MISHSSTQISQNNKSNNATQDATQKQRLASDPMVSSWVGASAGSGKTKVLTDRILRLMLPRENGEAASPPEKILALTFTKAAANEMALRLSSRLSKWAIIDDQGLMDDMTDNLLGRPPTSVEMDAARKLFARVVDTPGGLKIMTIHSFCQSVLGRFPIEAGIPPNFKPLEEEAAKALLHQSIKNILSNAGTDPTHPTARAIQRIGTQIGEDRFNLLISNIIRERYQFKKLLKSNFGLDGLYTKLCQWLDIRPALSPKEALEEFCTSTIIDDAGLRRACATLAFSKAKKSPERAMDIQRFLDADTQTRTTLYPDYKNIFLTKEGDIRASLADAQSKAKDPLIEDVLGTEAQRVYAFEDTLKSIEIAQSTYDLFTLGEAIIENYQILKENQGGLDFDDLILKTLSLIKGDTITANNQDMTPWIMYKMDGGLDHILIDEAQDTNPEQWEIIQILASEFFTGHDGHDATRTLFVVGDEKQSIFGFQRAAPEKFGDMKKWFEKKIINCGQKFVPVAIDTSFRSSQTILDAVDCVFAQESISASFQEQYRNHKANRDGQAGIVEIWPVVRTKASKDSEQNELIEQQSRHEKLIKWDIPDKPIESLSGSLQMAQKITNTIDHWLKTGERLASYNRPINAGDILVLVKSRNAFVGQLVRLLKLKNIPVSGVDRMVLNDQLVVQDLCAAAQFGLLPEDDLTLACLLKSPFIGLNEDELYELCQGTKTSLWAALKASHQIEHKSITGWLGDIIKLAGTAMPYDFFARIVQQPCPASTISGLQAIRLRLGTDSLDPLDEFLNIALSYDTSHNGCLQSFLKWHQTGSNEIKRELQEGGGAIRIMTVHGAKGLQAPIVFLPDTVRTRLSEQSPIFWPHATGFEIPFYAPSLKKLPLRALPHKEIIDQKQNEEYRRLLYVAMTRAEERLYIGGYTGKKETKENSNVVYWHNDVYAGLLNYGKTQTLLNKDEQDSKPTLKLEGIQTAKPDKANDKQKDMDNLSLLTIPEWVYKPIPEEPDPAKPLIPSRPSQDDASLPSPLEYLHNQHRFKRGNLTHKLLQTLPDIETDKRAKTTEIFLSNKAYGLDQSTQDSIAAEVISILNHPDFGKIFGPGSLAEVPLTGLMGKNEVISGQIDRLLITTDEAYIIDYKTNRPPPDSILDVPIIYIRQLKLYADALKSIYPDKRVRAALLWTDNAQLMEIPL